MPRCIPSWIPFLDRFLVDVCSQLPPIGYQKPWFSPKNNMKTRLAKLTSMFDPILVPTWLHFGTQNPPKSTQKSIPRGIQKMIDFWIDFLPKLAPFWDPSWDPRAAQDGPKTSPKTSQDATKTAQEPQEHPRSKFNRFLVPKSDGVPLLPGLDFRPFWFNCGRCLIDFWSIFY